MVSGRLGLYSAMGRCPMIATLADIPFEVLSPSSYRSAQFQMLTITFNGLTWDLFDGKITRPFPSRDAAAEYLSQALRVAIMDHYR